jgi:hypothetical protein
MLDSTFQFARIVRSVAVLNSRELTRLVKARIGMPERAVNFDQGMYSRDVKVVAIAAQPVLLLVRNAQAIEDCGELLLKSVARFASAAPPRSDRRSAQHGAGALRRC